MAYYLQNKMFMLKKNKNIRFWAGMPPWIFIGAVVVLFPIFAFMTIENIHRYKKNSARLLLEKGSALIRSFEAGTRTGLEMRWSGNQLQRLLAETAQQSDIVYLLVTDAGGKILAHNDPSQIGKKHGTGTDFKKVSHSSNVRWRLVTKNSGEKIFEVFRKFSPSGKNANRHQFRIMIYRCLNPHTSCKNMRKSEPLIIFIGLDMRPIDEAERADTYHNIVMGMILLFIGLAGIMLLFLAQGYRAARTSLSRIKAFSDNVVENMPIGLFVIDGNKKVASFNTVAGAILGLSPDEVIGKDAAGILPHELWKQIERLDVKQGVVEREIDCPVNSGKSVPLEVSATMLYDERGTFLGYVMLFKDLSEVQSLRKEIARSQRLASVGSLAAGVAHEIRNPLSSIKGFATYFKERYADVSEDQQIANIMIQEVDRLNRVIGQLLELSRPVIISGQSVRIRMFMEDSVRLVERQAAEKKIGIETAFPPETKEIFIDRDRISQVLLNLYLNALESMEEGGTLSVTLSDNGKKKGIGISVSDTGAGISKADLGRIFDPYFTTKASGTGLGLAIVHNILEAHDGKIKVSSGAGQGTVVSIFLPYDSPSGESDRIFPK